MNEPIIVISPQAGFCNRLRAMCSAIFLAEKNNIKIAHMWDGKSFQIQPFNYINIIQNKPFEYFFVNTIPVYSENYKNINICYTEWMPNDAWYQFQSYGQIKLNIKNLKLINNIPYNNINESFLIESALDFLNLSKQDKFNIYSKYFIPNNNFLIHLENIPNDTIAIHIRCNNSFLDYHPKSKINNINFFNFISKIDNNVLLLSDNNEFKNIARKYLKKPLISKYENIEIPDEDKAFLDFLSLSKCKKIYGTFQSSFAEEASNFGNSEYIAITNDMLNKFQLKKKENYDTVVIAILAKDKGHVLSFYLDCILNQTYPKNKIHLYIRTNDNTDNTIEVLNKFVKQHHKQYASTYFDKRSISDELKKYSQHEWNTIRFKILGKIRQESIDYAIKKNAHYFVIDCDNFILPHTLEEMVNMKHLNVIAPMLVTTTAYSNFHYDIDNNGYLKEHEMYLKLLNKEIKGVAEVKVIHCTYFINNSILNKIYYDDNTFRYEYVIFSDCLRKANIPQYLDNRMEYGYITFSETKEQYLEEYNTHFRNMFKDKYTLLIP